LFEIRLFAAFVHPHKLMTGPIGRRTKLAHMPASDRLQRVFFAHGQWLDASGQRWPDAPVRPVALLFLRTLASAEDLMCRSLSGSVRSQQCRPRAPLPDDRTCKLA
jgi:hypothetical protein